MKSPRITAGLALVLASAGAVAWPGRACPPEQPAQYAATDEPPIQIQIPLELTAPDVTFPPPGFTVIPPIRVDFDNDAFQRALAEQMRLQGLLEKFRIEVESRSAVPFMPVEHDGIIGQITSLSAQVSLYNQQFGRPGARINRTIQFSGAISDLSGSRAFRIVAPPRLLELTDEQGRDLRDSWDWSPYPDVSNPQAFTRPSDSPGSMTSQSFSMSGSGEGELPRRIGVLRVEIDVAVAGAIVSGTLRAEPGDACQSILPGVEARIALRHEQNGTTTLGVEYRLPVGADRPWFVRAEILDDERRVLATVENASEVETRAAVIGSVPVWNVDTRSAPAYYVRLQFVPAGATKRVEIVEHDLPLLGG